MSRTKKSRKPGRAKTISEPRNKVIEEKEPRARKTSGNKAGTRQQVAFTKTTQTENVKDKDPRIGSKKPIDLGAPTTPVKQAKPKAKVVQQPIAPIKDVEVDTTEIELLEKELFAIEDNEELQILAARAEAGEELTENEAQTLSDSFDRYEELLEALGIETEDDDEEYEDEVSEDSEDKLWDKLDDTDFSEFKE
ncbi:Der GTPase-activating protein YihI [Thalassotalea nanhaiensis]|uniref:Der GTPase-activating protein YihI n=1 Tax=Thalassotalea nanhaiensis TaxID=3065648 RepID=A0ABY9TIV8_9GAMM|nr:Der GTPase-activating protein YihI [Colwelliaceae bacterium SQ345]